MSVGPNHLVRLLGDWASGQGPLHHQLTDQLRELVRTGTLPAGTKLPSERSLGTALHLSRTTVSVSFDALRQEGLFTSRQGDGTYVSGAGVHAGARGDDRLATFTSGPDTGGDRIDLRSAALPGLSWVADELGRIGAEELRSLVGSHGYLPSGLPQLRQAVADHYAELGLPTTAEQILITSGAQQALQLIATSVLEPGATVAIEEPSFRGAIEILRVAHARLVPVPSGQAGIDPAALARVIRRYRPALIVIQSTVHNPTGSVLSPGRRAAVAALAANAGIPIVDDIAPADTLVDGPTPPPLAAFGGSTLTLGSMSKAFWGGLRVGWIRAEHTALVPLALLKGGHDLGTSLLAQHAATRLLPRLPEARAERRAHLSVARAALLDELALRLPDWSPQLPAGGASMWIKLPGPGATAFAQRADRAGVSVLPGPTFSSIDALDDHLRLAFAAEPPTLRAGVRRLAAVWSAFGHQAKGA